MRKCIYAALVTLILAGAVYAQEDVAQAARLHPLFRHQ